jgi:putative transposase
MPRIPRVVVPGLPHHVTQRGARRMRVFFLEDDFALYLALLGEQTRRRRVSVWAYCLMPNHVHLIAVPSDRSGLARAVGEAHRRFAEEINRRQGWQGHLWQERFWSFPLDEPALPAVTRYVLRNPVRAGLVARPHEWPYSSAGALLGRRADALVDNSPLARRIDGWERWLEEQESAPEAAEIRRHSGSGRPLGDEAFLGNVERLVERALRPKAPGRPSTRPSLTAPV